MAAPGGLTPFEDFVSVSYELINYNTLQPITHSGNYAEVNNSQFIFLKVHSLLTGFDKRVNRIILTFKQYTHLNYQVYLKVSNSAHLLSSTQIPLNKKTSNNIIYYEADITDIVVSSPTEEHYFAITTSSSMSFYVNGNNKPDASIISYSVKTGNYSPYFFDRLKTYQLRNYSLKVDLFSLVPVHVFNLFDYSDELVSFNLSLVNDFTHKDTSNITQTISTGFPKGFKLNIQQYIYSSGNRTYTYIDENYCSHVFKKCTNDNDTFTHFVDSNGSYLILEVISNGYKIYSLDGNVKTFSSSGLLLNETIKNGSNTSIISYSYNSNLLISVSINNQSFISITYSSSSITISIPGNSSITLNFNSGSLLTSIVDQENATYQIEYDSGVAGLIESVSVTNNKKLSLSFNDNLMVETVSLYTYDSSTSNYTWNVDYDFSSGSYTTSYFDDDDLVYVYKFNGEGQIIQTTCYKNNYYNVLNVSCVKKTIGHTFLLSTDGPNYLKEVVYDLNTYSHFENSVSLFTNNQQASFLLKPKEKGQYFLYFEYLRNFINNYQSLNSLSVEISVNDQSNNTYQVVSNSTLDIDGFDKVNIFMKEIVIPIEYYNQNLNLCFSLSLGDSVIVIQNIRLYRIEENNNEYYGLNSYTGGNDLNLLTDETIPPHYYELTSSIPFEVDNLTYSVNSYYQDIKATLMAHFFLNKGILFYNKGKNAYYGSITKSGQSLDDLLLIKANYQNKRLSNDDEPYDGYKATVSFFDSDYFIEKGIQYNYSFQSMVSNEIKFDSNFLLVSQNKVLPFQFASGTNIQNNVFFYNKYCLDITNSYTSFGLLSCCSQTAYLKVGDNNGNPYFEKASGHYLYSLNNKYMSSHYQKLYEGTVEKNHIAQTYDYNSAGEVSKITDAYNKETSYSYNKFHSLTSLTAYNSGTYHNNNVSYNALLNPSSVSNVNNQNQATYSYDYKGRTSSVSYDSLILIYTYQQNQESIAHFDGNNSFSVSVRFSDVHLPTQVFSGGDSILVYHYANKYTSLPSLGNNTGDQLQSIYDYKNANSIKVKSFSYDDFGNLCSVSENGFHLDAATSYCVFANSLYGHTSNSPTILKTETYRQGASVIKEEKTYQYVSNPFISYKEINESAYPSRNIIIKQGVKATESGSPFIKVSIWSAPNEETASIESSFSYYQDENAKQTSFIKEQAVRKTFLNQPTDRSIAYSFDNNGNLNSIISSSSHFNINNSYSYNDFNELSSETSTGFGTINYQYDSKGNISVISKLNSSTVYVLSYDNYNRLISFTKTIGSNTPETFSCSGYSFGRPTTYKNKTLVWDKNELTQFDGVTFTYDGYGRRTSKSSTNRSVEYKYIGDILLEETVTEIKNNQTYIDTLRFIYDLNNSVIGFGLNDNVYLYVKDALNNVIAIYNQASVEICRYNYDAYGNSIITASITGGEILGNLNPIRYRSYYYDKETGLYYLKSRYYDPEICRFISMDDISYLDPQTLNGLNLYAYCLNNPIMYRDENGCFPLTAILCLTALVGLGLTIGGVASDNNVMTAIGLTMVAVPALISGGLAIAAGFGGATLTGIVGGVTLVAGLGTATFASAEYQEVFTGNNWILDAGMDEGLYNGLMITAATIATLGTIASSVGYSFKIKSIRQIGKIDKYYGIKFTQNTSSGNPRIRTLCLHPAHNNHPIHWQLNSFNPQTQSFSPLRRWNLLLRRIIGR